MTSDLPSPSHLPRVCDDAISGILKICLLVHMFLFLGAGPFLVKVISKTLPERQDLCAQCKEYCSEARRAALGRRHGALLPFGHSRKRIIYCFLPFLHLTLAIGLKLV